MAVTKATLVDSLGKMRSQGSVLDLTGANLKLLRKPYQRSKSLRPRPSPVSRTSLALNNIIWRMG